MPHHPEDDWTRPMPRTPRNGPRRDPDPTERIPRASTPPPRDPRYDDRYDDRQGYPEEGYEQGRYDEGYGEERYEQERYAAPRRPAGRPPRSRRPRYGVRRFLALLVLAVVAYLVVMVVVVAMVWGSVNRIDATPDVSDRPAAAAGENYLLVGTDSREQLTEEQRGEFGTGFTEGHRADTVMLLHVPTFGTPTLVSLPRDSYVEIRDLGWNKLNAAHSNGGPEMLVDTVERSTGLPVDGYMEIGFGGFVSVVDGVGGVDMCLDEPVADEKAHVDLPAGCQELTGEQALGYVRMRYSDPRGDIGRVERQREFLSALVDKMARPSTVLVPWRLHEVGTATGSAISLGDDTSMIEAGRMAWAMRQVASGEGNSVTVPVAEPNYQTEVGSAVLWDEERAAQLFTALRQGQDITVEP
ncbi:Cell envelope-associated transcriptional attenuator [Serinicoccus hydrothermalis]|uniref:Cell envelope-associated transcriptional attenuator n=1 Tax=Serinicoccus hydrothermalis TaxID=1758689 RepID=A0A1B1NAH8_9MICO|nr:LCP family protein [Serinicoccus hydrothermalis]ANS78436.1 Cell envelope-associated transcriptional attenuator [Serinicoccus hydrothermalis]